jgi:hypothetical protein
MTTHTQNVSYKSKTYVVLCYAKTQKDWFTAEKYREFQQHNTKLTEDVGKCFKSLVKHGYLLQIGELSRASYKITELGISALGHIGAFRVKSDLTAMANRARAAGRTGLPKANQVRLASIKKEKV